MTNWSMNRVAFSASHSERPHASVASFSLRCHNDDGNCLLANQFCCCCLYALRRLPAEWPKFSCEDNYRYHFWQTKKKKQKKLIGFFLYFQASVNAMSTHLRTLNCVTDGALRLAESSLLELLLFDDESDAWCQIKSKNAINIIFTTEP